MANRSQVMPWRGYAMLSCYHVQMNKQKRCGSVIVFQAKKMKWKQSQDEACGVLVLGVHRILASFSTAEMCAFICRWDHPCCFHFSPLIAGEWCYTDTFVGVWPQQMINLLFGVWSLASKPFQDVQTFGQSCRNVIKWLGNSRHAFRYKSWLDTECRYLWAG